MRASWGGALEVGSCRRYQAYRLASGTYTAVIHSNCDEAAPCAAAGGAYTLLVTTPGG